MIDHYIETRYPSDAAPQRLPAPDELWALMDKDGKVEAVEFLCPCGCGGGGYMPVNEGPPPGNRVWGYNKGPNGPTLTPSIRYLSGCKSHFNITDGKVIVHGDSGK